MLRATLMTSSLYLVFYFMRSQCRYFRQVVCLPRKNTAIRNQSILATDEPIVAHYRKTSIQVTALVVLANFSSIFSRNSGENIDSYILALHQINEPSGQHQKSWNACA
ncbi:uncharacterized protein BJ212DRAFT_1063621 [Suillus subaureus]|uniref:Secreted protein n=1 Tax=Suillus subaureus TaxID=48587 RepID=A0A9P7EG44_9AGAM|nr:uncharacterized protein BJ212DRAFT_1063621 [Suillus subaureus]KAG1819740.1 hypothetical protein BJ212DRAFT_1063621 [Suillus subaureus]